MEKIKDIINMENCALRVNEEIRNTKLLVLHSPSVSRGSVFVSVGSNRHFVISSLSLNIQFYIILRMFHVNLLFTIYVCRLSQFVWLLNLFFDIKSRFKYRYVISYFCLNWIKKLSIFF